MATIGLSKPYYAVYNNASGTVNYSNGAVMGKATEANIISIRAPREGSDTRTLKWAQTVNISIRAPREGSDF